jgi:hypothetical protein
MQYAKIYVFGKHNTPYEYGLFEFDITIINSEKVYICLVTGYANGIRFSHLCSALGNMKMTKEFFSLKHSSLYTKINLLIECILTTKGYCADIENTITGIVKAKMEDSVVMAVERAAIYNDTMQKDKYVCAITNTINNALKSNSDIAKEIKQYYSANKNTIIDTFLKNMKNNKMLTEQIHRNLIDALNSCS